MRRHKKKAPDLKGLADNAELKMRMAADARREDKMALKLPKLSKRTAMRLKIPWGPKKATAALTTAMLRNNIEIAYLNAFTDRARIGQCMAFFRALENTLGISGEEASMAAVDTVAELHRKSDVINPRNFASFSPLRAAGLVRRNMHGWGRLLGADPIIEAPTQEEVEIVSDAIGDGTLESIHALGRDAYELWPDDIDEVPESVLSFLMDAVPVSSEDLKMLLLREVRFAERHSNDASAFFESIGAW